MLPSGLLLCTAICYGGIVTFITLFGHEAGISNVGWFFLCNASMVLIVRPITGILFDRKGPEWVLLPGALFTLAGLLLLSYAHSEASLAAAAICYGIGFDLAAGAAGMDHRTCCTESPRCSQWNLLLSQ